MAEYRRQHWVPQSYLKRFSPDQAHIWLLDKPTGRIAYASIRDVAQRKYFNDGFLRDERGALTAEIPEGWVEQQFGKWETALSDMTRVALRVAQGGGADLDERRTMAICVAVQLTRTAAFRKRLASGVLGSLEADANAFLAEKMPEFAKEFRATLSFPPEWSAALHHRYVWESGDIPLIAVDLFHYIWRIGVNVTATPLCTSDTPVVNFVHDPFARDLSHAAGNGEDDIVRRIVVGDRPIYGVEIIFPLTPKVALLMYHPAYFTKMHSVQGRRMLLRESQVLHYNSLQLLECDRQLFSVVDNFDAIRAHAAKYEEAEID